MKDSRSLHLCAWSCLLLVALVIGCGDGDEPSSLEYLGSAKNVVLHPRSRIVPFDGSAVVSGIGEKGIEIKGVNLGNVEPGDYLIVIAPIEDQAREAIGHLGGFITLQKGWHIVPREQMPARYRTPGNARYSHFVTHFGLAGNRLIETGPLAVSGSKSYASKRYAQKRFIGSIARAFSRAASAVKSAGSSAVHAVASTATSAERAVTNAATVSASAVANEATKAETAVTNAATDIASDVTSGVEAAASAVATAASNLGPIEQVVSTIETVGVHFSEIVEGMALEVEQIATNPAAAFEEIKEFAEFLVTGEASFGISTDGSYNFNFQNVEIAKNEGGNAELHAMINGTLSFKYDEGASLNFKDYKPESIGYKANIQSGGNLTFSGLQGNGTFPIRTIRREPIVIDAGIPVILVPEIAVFGVIQATGNGGGTLTASTTATASSTATFSGLTGTADMSYSGSFTPISASANGFITLRVKPELKLYDVAGPYLDIAVINVNVAIPPSSSTAMISIATDAALGADLTGLGFSGFSPSAPLFSKTWDTFDVNL